jgi:diguanylate cyclase (GGDEF)-like protein
VVVPDRHRLAMEQEVLSRLHEPLWVAKASRRARPAAALAVVALAVYLTALLGLKFGLPGTNASPVWLAAGVELAAVLLLGRRALLAIFVGAVLAQLTVGVSPALSVVQGLPDVLDPFLVATALVYFSRGRVELLNVRDVTVLLVFGAGLAAATSASVGITVVTLVNHLPWSGYGTSWLTWWLGDVSGIILVAPLIVAAFQAPRSRVAFSRVAEGVFLAASIVLSSTVAFAGILDESFAKPAEYLTFTIVVWIAFRLGPQLTLVATNLVALIAIGAAYSAKGPFIRADLHGTLLFLQASMSALGVAALILASLVNERQHAHRALEQARDELEEKVRERTHQLEELAKHDPLTKLVNVRYFGEELERAVRQAERGHGSALLFADLDRLKACNDSHGHAFGDVVLTQVAAALQAEARKNDVVARLGGDEFGVLLDGAGLREAAIVSERMRKRVAMVGQTLNADIGLSGGIAVIDGKLDAQGVLTAADQAMYRAKTLGNSIAVAAR